MNNVIIEIFCLANVFLHYSYRITLYFCDCR